MPTPVFRARLLLAALLAPLSFGQSLEVGEAEPPLVLERTIPAWTAAEWSALRGKPVVVEFWATWCANCVEEIPRLNELAAKFEEVQFISVSDETPVVVEPFLAKRPIRGWVGLDRGGATFKAYGVEARPQTILVDRDGIVRGILHPAQLDAAVLSDLVANRPIKPYRLAGRQRILEDTTADPVFAVMLRFSGSKKPGGVFVIDPGKPEGNNIFLKTIIAFAYSVGERRLKGPEPLLSTRYDFCVLLPDRVRGDTELLREMLERSFKLKIRREAQEMDVVVLRLPPGNRPRSGGTGQMSMLTRMLESRLNRIALNETGLESYKFFELPEKTEELAESLRSQLGIELSFERRPVDVLVIDSLELPTFRIGLPGR